VIAEVNPRYSVRKDQLYPFVEMAAVGEDFQGILQMGTREMEGSGLARFCAGDTLFAKITPCPQNGKVAYVDALDGDVGLGSTEFIVLSPRDGCCPRFLYHLATSYDVRGRAVARMEGSTGRQRVPEEVFTKRLLVPIPPKEDQQAIAEFLDTIDASIAHTRSAAEDALRLRVALSQKLFTEGTRQEERRATEIGALPESWEVVALRDVVTEFQYGISTAMDESGEYPILRMGNLQGGDVIMDNLKYVTFGEESPDRYLLHRGDVLFNRTNSQELVGKVGIYRHDVPAVFASYLIRLHPDLERIDPYFLGQVLNTYPTQCRIKRYATPGVQQVNVNATNLGRVLVPLPSGDHGLDEQRRIAAVLEEADLKVRSYGPIIASLRALKDALMPELFSGRTRVPLSEPAVAS
jgi:type I restriction enzyme S subunit